MGGERESGDFRTVKSIFISGEEMIFPGKLWEDEAGQVGGGDYHFQVLHTLTVFWHFSSLPFW